MVPQDSHSPHIAQRRTPDVLNHTRPSPPPSSRSTSSTLHNLPSRRSRSSPHQTPTPSSPTTSTWMVTTMTYQYMNVRDTLHTRWLVFTHSQTPWAHDVFMFGPEGEAGERRSDIFECRCRTEPWPATLEPVGRVCLRRDRHHVVWPLLY